MTAFSNLDLSGLVAPKNFVLALSYSATTLSILNWAQKHLRVALNPSFCKYSDRLSASGRQNEPDKSSLEKTSRNTYTHQKTAKISNASAKIVGDVSTAIALS